LASELVRITSALEGARIAAIPFKGPVLAMTAYGDLALRSYGDLDIMVPEERLAEARRVLEGLGYDLLTPMNAREERAYLRTECAFLFHNSERGHHVELHWRFFERHASIDLPVAEFRMRAHAIRLAGTRVRLFATEDMLLYLCIHGAKHRWERLEWVCSVAETIRNHPQMDWAEIFEQAERHRICRVLHLGLMLAHSLCDAPLPLAVEQRIADDRAAAELAASVTRSLFQPVAEAPHYQERAARYLFMLRAREHWADRLRIFAHSAFKPPHPQATEWVDLPPHLAFLHRLFRPVRLLGQYGAVAWRHYVR
jgi:hypothetical protein